MMAKSLTSVLFCVLVVASFGGYALGKVSHPKIKSDDRAIILFDTFGFGGLGEGVIEVTITDDEVYVPSSSNAPVSKKKIGFFITSAEAEAQLEMDLNDGTCPLLNTGIKKLFTLADVEAQRSFDGSFTYTYRLKRDEFDEYSLFYTNCQDAPRALVSFHARIALYNEGPSGEKDYLSAGESPLPLIFFCSFLCYVVAGAVWGYLLYERRSTGTLKIHVLMGVLVVLKALTLLSLALMQQLIKYQGDPNGWNVVYYVFSFFRGVTLFVVIVLIGTGWSFLKPFLAQKEKKVLMVIIPLQVFANMATVVLDETGPSSRAWFTWRDLFHMVDVICCCAILFPIIWSIKNLRDASHTDGKASLNITKLTLFRQFYVMVVSYIYFTRIIVYLLKSTLPYEYIWAGDLAGEVATLLFYIVTGYKIMPAGDNPYLALDQGGAASGDGSP
eukprot:jgi/Mesvir1/14842/Mv05464-RA.1